MKECILEDKIANIWKRVHQVIQFETMLVLMVESCKL